MWRTKLKKTSNSSDMLLNNEKYTLANNKVLNNNLQQLKLNPTSLQSQKTKTQTFK